MSGLIQSIEMVGRGSWETNPKVNKSVILHCQAFFKLFGPGGDEGARKRGSDGLYGAIAIEDDDDAVGLEEESHSDNESLLLLMKQVELQMKKRAGGGE